MTVGLAAPDPALSVAMTAELHEQLSAHLDKGPLQEDLTFAYWRSSHGAKRTTAILCALVPPRDGERNLKGYVEFNPPYLKRVLAERPHDAGVALLHSHLGPGWQAMSRPDVVAERDRLAGPVWGQSGKPVLGLTRATDGAWSARTWPRTAPGRFGRRDAATVRVLGRHLRITRHPAFSAPQVTASQERTASVWGEQAQRELVRARIGIVGLGSVGSIVAEGLARVGFTDVSLIDFDILEDRNRDRTLAASTADVAAQLSKIQLAARNMSCASTAAKLTLRMLPKGLLDPDGLQAALDCDVLISCVDRPWPRFVMNSIAYAHLIPVIDGGIAAAVKPGGGLLHVDWRIHTVGPGNACLVCRGALLRGDVALDRAGKLEDPDYIKGLSPAEQARFAGRNVFPFSLSVAAHQLVQLTALLTGSPRLAGSGSQHYHGYPGTMTVDDPHCLPDCEFEPLTATAADQFPNIS